MKHINKTELNDCRLSQIPVTFKYTAFHAVMYCITRDSTKLRHENTQ